MENNEIEKKTTHEKGDDTGDLTSQDLVITPVSLTSTIGRVTICAELEIQIELRTDPSRVLRFIRQRPNMFDLQKKVVFPQIYYSINQIQFSFGNQKAKIGNSNTNKDDEEHGVEFSPRSRGLLPAETFQFADDDDSHTGQGDQPQIDHRVFGWNGENAMRKRGRLT